MTSPPRPRMAAMSLPKVELAIGMPLSPFQYTVHEPRLAVWMNAIVRYLSPDCWDRPLRLSPLYASKYGANTWAGMAAAAWADGVTARNTPAAVSATAAAPGARTAGDLRMGRRA